MPLGDLRKKLLGEAKSLMNALGPPIAVDFGVGALKVLQIAGNDTPTLVAAACLATPDDFLSDAPKRIAFQIDALPRLIRGVTFKGKRAVCAIPAAQSFCKNMQLQPEPGAPIPSLVRGAVSGQLGCDPNELVYRHIEATGAGKGSKGAEVICMAAHRDLVERLMKALKESRLEPVGMHVEYTAALRAFDSITRRAEDQKLTSLYLDMGAGMTKVSIAHGRDLVFCRSVDLAGRHLDATVAKQLRVSVAQARAHRLQMGDLSRKGAEARPAAVTAVAQEAPRAREAADHSPSGGLALLNAAMRKQGAVVEDRREGRPPPNCTPDISGQPGMRVAPAWADLSEPLEILTDEISMCLRYHESIFPDRRVDRAIFFGGEARHLGLCQHIARALKIPAQVADPMAGVGRAGTEPVIGVDFRQPQPGWAMPLGLCMAPTDL